MTTYTLYESASTDGYTTSGDGKYFLSEKDAGSHAYYKHGGHGRVISHHYIIRINEEYYKLVSPNPVVLYGSKQYTELLKQRAFDKLTREEQEALGL